jgi:acetate kinase
MASEQSADASVLIINGGSSSLKFALYRATTPPACIVSGKFDRIGLPEVTLSVSRGTDGPSRPRHVEVQSHADCVPIMAGVLWEEGAGTLQAVGHRVVHGGNTYYEPQGVTPEVLSQLRHLSPFAPAHMPSQVGLIEALGAYFPDLPQIACFDTAFHRGLPRVAKLLPIPRRYDAAGVQRYGFHGLSYTYLMHELSRLAGPQAANGRVILAHLGNGASMAAVRDGHSVDTTMGFTPAAGLVMSTRSGDLDPGVVEYLARTEGMSARQFYEMVHARSGLLGVSETSSDVRDLLARETEDVRAAEAVALFCYHAKKCLGGLAAVLNGLDTLVFAGGIGENAPAIRARICAGLDYLGLRLDPSRNEANAPVISAEQDPVTVRVIRTNEELLIARQVIGWLERQ